MYKNIRKGRISTIHFPGTDASENISIALLASSTNGSDPVGSIVYPYAIFRIIAPAVLYNRLNFVVNLTFK